MGSASRALSPYVGLMLAGVSTTTLAAAPPAPDLAACRSLEYTTPGASVSIERSSAASIAALRQLSGLTWDQLARLLGVSRRAVHFWAEGRPMAPSHEEHLQRLLAVVHELHRGSPQANRALLLDARPGEPMVFDLLSAADYSRALDLGRAAGERARGPAPLSGEARVARAPPPPEERVDTLPGRAATEPGRARAARSSRVPRAG
jgi:DNA-binding transcriptional regulator YiaG